MPKKSCLIIAGEKSGEEHTLSFFNDLKKKSPETHFFGVGGDELKNSGMELLYHLNDFSSWGYSEVFGKIPFYFKAMKHIIDEVKKRDCQTAILVDFQSFNLKLAARLKKMGVNVLYYVAPQAWVWKEYRVKKLARSIHTLFTILSFEKEWFFKRGVKKIISVDHPLWSTYKDDLLNFEKNTTINLPLKILLLPGSRAFEVEKLLPEFIAAIKILKKEIPLHVSIVKSTSVPGTLYENYKGFFDEEWRSEDITKAMRISDFSLAASGTVTLTCALYELPTVICYKTSLLNQFIYEVIVKYKGFIGLANIVQNRAVFPELLQDEVSAYNIVSNLKLWYYNKATRKDLEMKLKETKYFVRGEAIDVANYMAEIIDNSYGKKIDTTS